MALRKGSPRSLRQAKAERADGSGLTAMEEERMAESVAGTARRARDRGTGHSPGKAVCRQGRRQGPMELFWLNKYSVGHHEYSIRRRCADRSLRELELTGD